MEKSVLWGWPPVASKAFTRCLCSPSPHVIKTGRSFLRPKPIDSMKSINPMRPLQSVLFTLSFVVAAMTGHATVYFQNDGNQAGWPTMGQLPQDKGTITDVTSPAFQGNTAIKFTQTFDPNYSDRYHAEVHYQGTQFTGQTRYYGMTVFLPANWSLNDSKVALEQWAGTGPWIIIEVRGSNLVILSHIAGVQTVTSVTPGQWIRIVTQITDAANGSITVWVNGVQKYHRTGNLEAPAPNGEIRWSAGIYVTGWYPKPSSTPNPAYRELYEDHYRIADTEAEAEPANWDENSGPTPVADPTFSLGGGTYSSAQSVSIASATGGTSIRYTTDGSTPSEIAGTTYSVPVNISSSLTLRAIAYESGFADSNVISATYTITSPPPPQAAAPTFSPGGGTYSSAQSVSITSATGGTSIRYTTDGSTPSETVGTIYSIPVSIGSTETLQAMAYESGFTDSTVSSALYTITTTPPPPLNFEAENLAYTPNGATASVQSDIKSSGGKWIELAGNSVGDYIDFTLPNVPAGTYQLKMEWKGNNSRGILQLSVDGTDLGGTLDQYSSSQTYPTTTFGQCDLRHGGQPHRPTDRHRQK